MREPPPAVESTTSMFVASTFPIDPTVVIVDVATFHMVAGSAVIDEAIDESDVPSEVEALSTCVFVLAFTTAAIDVDAVSVVALVFAFTIVATELEAVCTSERVASEPESNPAPVKVLVPFVHTSAASVPKPVNVRLPEAQISETSVPNVVSERVVAFQTLTGMVTAREEDAVLMSVVTFADMTDASDELAVSTLLSVLAFTTAAIEDDAVTSPAFVFELTAVVPAVIAELREEVAVCTSERVARLPESSVAPVRVLVAAPHISAAIVVPEVRVRVPEAQISATRVPNEESVRDEYVHIEAGRVAASEEEAVKTALFVFVFTSAATELEETILFVISNVRSNLTRLPFNDDPHDMTVGHMPMLSVGVNEYSYQLFAEAVIEAALTSTEPLGS